MRTYRYSDRGAKRGLLTICVFVILWSCWAIAFSNGLLDKANKSNQDIEFKLVELPRTP